MIQLSNIEDIPGQTERKRGIGIVLRRVVPFRPPVVNHRRECAVVRVQRSLGVLFSLIPDCAIYGHIKEGEDHRVPEATQFRGPDK